MISKKKEFTYPVIDLFAGPGGLGEGFSSCEENRFEVLLSIENNSVACRTLRLRSFFRQFPKGKAPDEYYAVLRDEISDKELFKSYIKEAKAARNATWLAELGNEPSHKIDKRIKEALQGAKHWVLIGGPPCQAYSLAGRSRNKGIADYKPEKDGRNFLYKEYLRVLAKHLPPVFVMENVKGLLSSKINGKLIFHQILKDLENPHRAINGKNDHETCGYRIHSLVASASSNCDLSGKRLNPHEYIIRCERYGVPQARHRVILLGIRDDFDDISPSHLVPVAKAQRPTVVDVIGGLPRLRSGISKSEDGDIKWQEEIRSSLGKRWLERGVAKVAGEEVYELIKRTIANLSLPRQSRGAEYIDLSTNFKHVANETLRSILERWYHDRRLAGVCNSSTRGHMSNDLKRYLFAACFVKEHGHSPKLFEFPKDLEPNHRNARSGHFSDRFRVQVANKQACTITSHISKDGHYYIHYDPSQCRSLTVREAARIQTFPDNYYFCGNRTQQYVQVGNAVPPFLAQKIAKAVLGILDSL